MFLSANPERLLAAACEATTELASRTPLAAGAGIARGPVVRRGGDWFGTPVNLASRLAEIAEAGEVLVDDEAVCDTLVAASWRSVIPRGLPGGRRAAVVRPGG
jgi:class 3 adenylate cyclase